METLILKCCVNEKTLRMLPRPIKLRIESSVMDFVQLGMNVRVLQEVE